MTEREGKSSDRIEDEPDECTTSNDVLFGAVSQ